MSIKSKPIIRPYSLKEYPQVRKNLEEGKLFYELMDSEEKFKRAVTISPGCIIVAELHGEVVGSVIVQDLYGPVFFRLVVRSEHRGKGIGKLLNEAAKKRAKDLGYNQAHILVAEEKTELKKMYQRWGYKEDGLYRWMYINL